MEIGVYKTISNNVVKRFLKFIVFEENEKKKKTFDVICVLKKPIIEYQSW